MWEDDISVIQDSAFAAGLFVGGADFDLDVAAVVVDRNSSDMIELVLADAAACYFDM